MKKLTDEERRDLAWGRYVDGLKRLGLRFTLSQQIAFMKGWAAKTNSNRAQARASKRRGK